MTPERATAAIERGAREVLTRPIALTVPGRAEPVSVVPVDAGLRVDAARSLDGLTGFTLDPRTIWAKLTGSLRLPLLTSVDDDRLTAYLDALAPRVEQPPREGRVTFPAGRVTVEMPRSGRTLDVVGTKLALRRAFPESTTAVAAVRDTAPTVAGAAVEQFADTTAAAIVSGPVTLVAGTSRVVVQPTELVPFVKVEADGSGGLRASFDEPGLARLVAAKVTVPTRSATSARWVFGPGNGAPRLVPSVDGAAVDEDAVAKAVVAAVTGTGTGRTVTVAAVPAKPPFSTQDAVRAGITTKVVEFSSPFPTDDPSRTNNLVVATQRLDGTYVPPGGTFSLNAILGERTEDKGYADGTVIIDGRLTRGTGGGVSQVSTVVYNLAYFAGVRFLEFRPHAFFIPRYPEGREATVYWPSIDNRWTNDTPYGMLLQTWVDKGQVHGRVWSTKVWDVRSVKGPRTNVRPPRTIRSDSATCYPQQPNPGFDVTVTRQWYRPGSPTLVRSEDVTTHYVPEDEVICTNPGATPP
jgi:vancomycin resistance protein YoaR